MTLAFYQIYPAELPLIGAKKTFFVFKIQKAIQLECLKHQQKILFNHGQIGDTLMAAVVPKLHTIREDKLGRWQQGNDIHFIINDRTKSREQFLPVVKCVSTQKIEIIAKPCVVIVDDIVLSIDATRLLAINDGFTSAAEFFAYFNTDFTGKIIHWTNLK